MMSGLNQEKFDAVFFTGYHAWAGCPGNPLSHTMNGRNNHVFLNDTLCSEFLINSYTAGYYGVPVALLTGDKALCDFAKTLIPAITTVPVNEGRGGSVTSLHPDEAVERIEAAAKEAVAKAAQCVVPMPEHFHMDRFRQAPCGLLQELLPRCDPERRQIRLLRLRRLVRGSALLPLRSQRRLIPKARLESRAFALQIAFFVL